MIHNTPSAHLHQENWWCINGTDVLIPQWGQSPTTSQKVDAYLDQDTAHGIPLFQIHYCYSHFTTCLRLCVKHLEREDTMLQYCILVARRVMFKGPIIFMRGSAQDWLIRKCPKQNQSHEPCTKLQLFDTLDSHKIFYGVQILGISSEPSSLTWKHHFRW
jgi:hypothetical protein